jgi:hypothetical protein
MFAVKGGAYPGGAYLKGELLTLPSNIILGWKGLPRTNTLAYFGHLKVMKGKKACEFGYMSLYILCLCF